MLLSSGLYWCPAPNANSFLRFYDDGRVIEVSSTGAPDEVSAWFHWQHESVLRGTYCTRGRTVALVTVSDSGTVARSGDVVSPHALMLETFSFINEHRAHGMGYDFHPVPSFTS